MNFNNPYNRADFLNFIEDKFLPDDFNIIEEKYENLNFATRYTIDASKLGTCRSMELDVFEITHMSSYDARVGIAQDAFRLMLHKSYNNRALVIFKQEDSPQYRFSLLQIEAEQAENSSRITRSFSNPRRYSFLLGENAHIKTPEQFLLEKGKLTLKDGSYFNDLQERFSVEVLTKLFYKELSDWYFWALKQVEFPSKPTSAKAHEVGKPLEDLQKEHNATNVIRMLTRILFVWFIKQKGLIPEELFDEKELKNNILTELNPIKQIGLFSQTGKDSVYYKAILQNLFFASLNCPINPQSDDEDKRERGFRRDAKYGDDFGNDWLFRYRKYFKNPDAFVKLINSKVPFLNGGLFECLDDKQNKVYVDGFSDNMAKGERLIVPDYIFFGRDENVDLSDDYDENTPQVRQASVKGLINILKTYNFTVEENTPAEVEVALDPELLGKVFENLLASYNPETKTTARKQTGSFYTPREIVNYMVDESLIANLKNAIADWGGLDDETLDKELHVLTSFDSKVPFDDNPQLQKEIITALSSCTILDPACGSGAFPMGILQKMVHILQKLDPENKVWKEVQLDKARKESEAAFEIEDKQAREERLLEINEAFDQSINDPDYARKLFLIENCIYGVDIQPIATQISKLRFFISLVVEQKVNAEKNNFGIRPLPNLETKFVAANTLIGIKKDGGLFETEEVKKLENELKIVRHKIFSLKSKERKIAWREKDKELREKLSTVLKNQGLPLDAAEKLAGWDPYDQNASSSFFDPEWMFDIQDGFDVVIGNPPYVSVKGISSENKKIFSQIFETGKGRFNLFTLFIEKAINILGKNGVLTFIIPEGILSNIEYIHSRKYILDTGNLNVISLFSERVFEAAVDTCVVSFIKNNINQNINIYQDAKDLTHSITKQEIYESPNFVIPVQSQGNDKIIIESFMSKSFDNLSDLIELQQGIIYSGQAKEDVFSNEAINSNYKKSLDGRDISKWKINWNQKNENKYINYTSKLHRPREERLFISKPKIVFPRKANSIYCAIDLDSHYALNTAYVVLIKNNKCSYSYLASWLNSKLVNFVYSKLYFGWQITIPALMTMKIKSPSSSVSKLFDFLVFSSPEKFDQIIDSVILDYYFHDHMKERGIDVLEFVDRDINEVMQGREFEKLSDSEKEEVIEALHAKWSHPDNEVVKRIKLFAVRSPEILKPILES